MYSSGPTPENFGEDPKSVAFTEAHNVGLVDAYAGHSQCASCGHARGPKHEWGGQVNDIGVKLFESCIDAWTGCTHGQGVNFGNFEGRDSDDRKSHKFGFVPEATDNGWGDDEKLMVVGLRVFSYANNGVGNAVDIGQERFGYYGYPHGDIICALVNS